ncbi:hypothetical protein [Planomonospora algeriensis]
MPETNHEITLDAALSEEAVLTTYRRMFAALARDSGAVVDDPALVDIAETLFTAFAEAGEEWLTHEQMRHACRAYPLEMFENRLRVLKGLGAVREVFPKPHQLRYRASFTSMVGLMFIRRMLHDGGQSEVHRLLALEDLNVADPRTTMEEARASAQNLARAFRLWALELITLTAGTIEELREQAPTLWGTEEIARRAQSLHATILTHWPALDRTCTELRAAIYSYSDASRRAAGRLAESAGTTRNLTLLPAETWRTFAQTAGKERLAVVLDGFVFDAPAPWHDPAAIVRAVDESPRPAPVQPTPPRPALPDPGPADSYRARRRRARPPGLGRRDRARRALLGPAGGAAHRRRRVGLGPPPARRPRRRRPASRVALPPALVRRPVRRARGRARLALPRPAGEGRP